MTGDTLFRIASMTKPLVAVGALQLVEAGRLRLDDEVASIVPEYGELQVLDGFGGDAPCCARRGRRPPSASCSPTPPGVATGSATRSWPATGS